MENGNQIRNGKFSHDKTPDFVCLSLRQASLLPPLGVPFGPRLAGRSLAKNVQFFFTMPPPHGLRGRTGHLFCFERMEFGQGLDTSTFHQSSPGNCRLSTHWVGLLSAPRVQEPTAREFFDLTACKLTLRLSFLI